MRAPLVEKVVGATAGAGLAVNAVKCAFWRNFWFVSTRAGATYTLDAYGTREDALAGQSKLATGTHGGPGDFTVALALAGGAPWDPTPLSVVLSVAGQYDSALVGVVDDLGYQTARRVQDILTAYRGPNEALAAVKSIHVGGLAHPSLVSPAILIWPAFETLAESGGAAHDVTVALDVVVWVAVLKDDLATRLLHKVAGAVRSILLDEHRKLGGWVHDVTANGNISFTAGELGEDSFYFEARVPINVRYRDVLVAEGTTVAPRGMGGKYLAGL